jgi:hypothetical protein
MKTSSRSQTCFLKSADDMLAFWTWPVRISRAVLEHRVVHHLLGDEDDRGFGR